MGKKRKVELDLDMERTMYSSFVTAANAVSQLYTQGVQQQRRAAAAASKATLVSCVCWSAALLFLVQPERLLLFVLTSTSPSFTHTLQEKVVTFVLRQEEGSESISKAALLQFLQHEYEVGGQLPMPTGRQQLPFDRYCG